MEESLAFVAERQIQENQSVLTAAEFVAEAVPQRAGQAAVLSPGTAQERLVVADGAVTLPEGDFSIEAVVLLHSVFQDGRVRTIASQWNGDHSQSGWSLGITGMGSHRKPYMPVFQLVGPGVDGRVVEEPVFSEIQLQMDRSYYIAAAVQFSPQGKSSVTFYIKDLANDDEPIRTTTVPHPLQGPLRPGFPLVIGDTHGTGRRLWDGLVDEVRLRRGAISEPALSLKAPNLSADTIACWQFEPAHGHRHDAVSGTENILPGQTSSTTARLTAITDFCHSLMGSSAMLYVE